jgi:MFS family permease
VSIGNVRDPAVEQSVVTPGAPEHGRSGFSQSRWYIVTILALATFLSYLDRGVIAVVVPSLKADLNLSDLQISLLQGISFSLFFALAGIPMGTLADRVSRRNLIVVGLGLWSLMTMLCGFAGNFTMLFIARMGVGVGEAALIPAAASMIADLFAPSQRGRPTSAIVAAQSLGAAGASLLGGMLLVYLASTSPITLPFVGEAADWRTTFIAFGLPGPIVALLLASIKEPERTKVDGKSEGNFLRFLGTHRLLFFFVYLSFAANFVIAYSTALWSPTVLSRVYGLTPGHAGIAFGLTMIIANITGSTLAGIIGDRLASRGASAARFYVSITAAPLAAVGGLIMLLAPTATYYLAGFACAGFAAGVLIGNSYPLLYDVVPGTMRGQAAAVYMIVGNIIGLGGGPLAVAILTQLIFKDQAAAGMSVGLVVLASGCICLTFMLLASRAYGLLSRTAGDGAA